MQITVLLAQAKSQLHTLEQVAGGIGLHVHVNKIEYLSFNQGDISTLNSDSLKLADKFTYLSRSVTSTESDINTCLAKA